MTSPILETRIRGHKVLMKTSRHNEIAAFGLYVPYGSVFDPAGRDGLGALKQRVMRKGAGGRDHLELAEAIEELGSSISASSSRDYAKFGLAASARCFFETLDLMGEMIHAPTFAAEELGKERELQIAHLRMDDDVPSHFASRHFAAALYGEHPYGRRTVGTPETLAAIERDDLLASHARQIATRGAVVVAAGNFDADELAARLESFLPEPAFDEPSLDEDFEALAAATPADLRLEKECEQAFLCTGWRTVPMAHPDYPAVRVLAALLGQGMGSRMFIRLRDEKGLAYSTGCSSAGHRRMSHLRMYIGTGPDRIDESIAGFEELIDEVRASLPTADEMTRARNIVAGQFLIDHQENASQAGYLGYFEMMGLGYEADAQYAERIEAVTAEQVREAAQRYMTTATRVLLLPTADGGASVEDEVEVEVEDDDGDDGD